MKTNKTSTVQPKSINSSSKLSAGPKTCIDEQLNSCANGLTNADKPMLGWRIVNGKRVPSATRTAYQENIRSLLDLHSDYVPLEPLTPRGGPLEPEKPKYQPYDELYAKQRKTYKDNGFI